MRKALVQDLHEKRNKTCTVVTHKDGVGEDKQIVGTYTKQNKKGREKMKVLVELVSYVGFHSLKGK